MSVQNSAPPLDKSRVLDVKPLRSLAPMFPSSPQAPPFICSPPFGPFPPGFSPFYPFTKHQGSTNSSMDASGEAMGMPFQNQHVDAGGLAGMKKKNETSRQRRAAPRSSNVLRKKPKKSRNPALDGSKGPSKEFVIGFSSFQRDDGNSEMVNYVLMTFDVVRRRLSQVEDAKESPTGLIRRADLKSGNILMSKGIRTNMRKRIGVVPGVEIGDIFFFRMEMCLVGLHSQSMGGIDYMIVKGDVEEEPLAVSIVSSGGYDDDVEDTDVLIYSGQGGNINKKDKQVADQKLERGNLALERSFHQANAVRVIRGMKDAVNSSTRVYVYDGLYAIQESWMEKGKSGCNVFKYKFVRIPGQPSALDVWKSIQRWKEGFSSRAGLILPDLTSGAESIPVSLLNDVDDETGPAYFTYLPTLKYSKSFKLLQPSFGCNCHNACLPGDLNCSCIRKNGGDFPYTANGVLVSQKPLVHECGPTCPCFPNCKNRVSQTGLKVRLEVFKTTNRGWGLRLCDPIRAGTFICEFAGEVIERVKLKQHGGEGENDDYVFDTTRIYDSSFKWNYEPSLLDEEMPGDFDEDYKGSPLIISAKNVGNVARFMNHSCSPNVFWQLVLYEHNSESFLHVAFFAIKHIPPLTELTYDYGTIQSDTNGKKKCFCGSSKCRGSFG